jgi:hypothetical protein
MSFFTLTTVAVWYQSSVAADCLARACGDIKRTKHTPDSTKAFRTSPPAKRLYAFRERSRMKNIPAFPAET